ncbi:MAG: transporter [Anaerolineales bacterium]|nr:transporter [Anaerolineales bacterium]
MQISARNIFSGRVKKITDGVVNSEITIELPGGLEIVSIITKQSAVALKLEEGKQVSAVIKASNVMVSVE